jgi:hypothetical protein
MFFWSITILLMWTIGHTEQFNFQFIIKIKEGKYKFHTIQIISTNMKIKILKIKK